ncbi:clindamycin resistance transfer factor BtgB [Bacteroides sp. AM18-9]|nr:clindamycin resistance transfer factor BtgB [Bacteroides sp. AM18-9]
MHIDFTPPTNGTYNNSGSSRRLANYLEHEDLERMEKGIYTEGFFNLTEDNIYKSKVIKDIDANIGQLLKTDAKFYAIHVSPSKKEIQAMGNTEQEQAEAMKRYIREVFIPEYAKNFNKELSATEIKFYGKIHFDRSRSNNELNIHCHLIVSRKDQVNKKKLSPLTNHKNTKNGIIKGGFDRVNLFLQLEQGFDKLFNYNRQPKESFTYRNTMTNGSISEQFKLQELDSQSCERKIAISQDSNQENLFSVNLENKEASNQKDSQVHNTFNIFGLAGTYSSFSEEQILKRPKKKKKRKL